MNAKHEKLFRLAAERTGTPYETIVEEYKKLSHDQKRKTLHDLKFTLKRPKIGGTEEETSIMTPKKEYFPL